MTDDTSSFVGAFAEWVEATWFGERDAAGRLEAVLQFPTEVVLAGSLAVLGRLVEALAPVGRADVGGALAAHLVMTGPDPEREALIRAVVLGAGTGTSTRTALVARYGEGPVTVTSLECASVLAQMLAEREGVVPSSILLDQ